MQSLTQATRYSGVIVPSAPGCSLAAHRARWASCVARTRSARAWTAAGSSRPRSVSRPAIWRTAVPRSAMA